MTKQRPAKMVDLDVTGIKTLELVVGHGEDDVTSDHADWADAARHTGYHIEILIVGVDEEFHRVLTRKNSDARLTGLPTGKTVRVRVNAVNTAGEGAYSDVVEIVVP